jgi:hypothetical protein
LPAPLRIGKQRIDGLRQALRILDRNQLASFAERGGAGNPRGYDGRAAGHSLEEDEGHSVVA